MKRPLTASRVTLVDVRMPAMDGLTLTERLREALPSCSGLRIVDLSAAIGKTERPTPAPYATTCRPPSANPERPRARWPP
jgi:CheY-like chemotaxis protein